MSLHDYVKIYGEGSRDTYKLRWSLIPFETFLILILSGFFSLSSDWTQQGILQGSLDGAEAWPISLEIPGHTPHSPGCTSLPWEVLPDVPLLRKRGWHWADDAVPDLTAPPASGSCDHWGQWRDVPMWRIRLRGAKLVLRKRGHIRVVPSWTGHQAARRNRNENFTTPKVIHKGGYDAAG